MTAVGWGTASETGPVRSTNEDSVLAHGSVFVVADGMGGHAAGEVASRLVVEEFGRLGEETNQPADVLGALARANAAILDVAAKDPSRRGMGTTAVGLALVTEGDREYWLAFNVGDSRLYRFRDGTLEQLSVDHTEVQELVAAGLISAEGSRAHPRHHVLTRALGTDPAPAVDTWMFVPVTGERFLLCSDGLVELPDERIAAVLAEVDDPPAAAERLVAAAIEAGARDNVTALVVQVVEGDAESGTNGATAKRPRPTPH
jgi:serine/threonine protein phosphatase PrpC